MKKKKKKESSLRSASPEEVVKCFAGEVFLLGGVSADWDGEVISTGLPSLDAAIGVGGLPLGRIVELFGEESSAKTSLSLHVCGRAQEAGKRCLYIDVEHSLNKEYASKLCDVNSLMLAQPDSAEDALDLLYRTLLRRAADVIVLDSVASLLPQAEEERGLQKATMGLQPALMSKAMRFVYSKIRKSNALVIFINQNRAKIGVMFGNPMTTSGGKALKYAASLRMSIRVVHPYKSKGRMRGIDVAVRIVKNKMGPPFKIANIRLLYNKGFRDLGKKEK